MSNYTIAVNWSGKDALSDSDAAKVISGSDFNTEFTTVQTAVNTKADVNGSATESFSATTATAGTNTTQVATTAFVKTFLLSVYPVGVIYMSQASTNPSTLFGGTWAVFGAGRTLVGLDTTDADFDGSEETGGAKTHTIATNELPAHTHGIPTQAAGYVDSHYDLTAVSGSFNGTVGANIASTSTGSGAAHNNLQPYIVVYMWKRTA